MLAEWTNEWRTYITLQSHNPEVLCFSQRPRAKGLNFSSCSSILFSNISVLLPYPRRCLRHPKPSKMRPTSSSSGNLMALRTTLSRLPIQSCLLPQSKMAWCTWQVGNPLSLTFRYWKTSLDSGVHLLVKCWQSVCTMYMKKSNPLLLVTHGACAEPS